MRRLKPKLSCLGFLLNKKNMDYRKTILLYIVIAILIVAGIFISDYFFPQQDYSNQSTQASSDNVKIMNGVGGQYLTDEKGMSLYYFTKDTINKNNCTGACADVWPIFYSENSAVSLPLKSSDFATITGNNTEQSTYKGQPIYYYKGDVKPGDVLGDGIGGVWFLAKP